MISGLPTVSFVVPLFNQLEHSQAMLATLLNSIPDGMEHEIILIDDASTDGTSDWIFSLAHPSIKAFRNVINLGYAATNNTAVQQAKGDVLALLNNDLLLSKDWLMPMLEVLMLPGFQVGAVGNIQVRTVDDDIDHVGIHMNHRGHLTHTREMVSTEKSLIKSLAVTGACMLVRRNDFLACGCFDENFHNGGEDVDLCFKLQELGLRTYVATQSCVRHHVSCSRGAGSSLTNERNSRLLYSKWRKKLKYELAAEWRKLLVNYGSYEVPPTHWVEEELLAMPCLASLRIAEAILCEQESRWDILLDGS